MNRKGVFFTIMVVLVLLALIGLAQLIEQKRAESQEVFEAFHLLDVKNYYSNIEKDIVDLVKTGIRKNMAERVLPFSYNLDLNRISLMQELPVRQTTLDNFFDLINTYAIFISDKNYSHAYWGLDVNAITIRNGGTNSWGGSIEKLQFLIEPFCTGVIVDKNGKSLVLSSIGNSRCSDYNFSKTRLVDINVIVKNEIEDYNSIIWDRNDFGTGQPDPAVCTGACPNQDYNTQNPGLYYRFFFTDTACIKCGFPPGTQKTIREQIPYTSKVKIRVICSGTNCNSDELGFTIDNGIIVTHTSNERLDVNLTTTFDANIARFYFLDFNYFVKGRDFNAFKTNNPDSFS